ncbi:SGNH/GDSL hydrolase family protein [Geodermatophilus sp. CPCC 206100]|uniref:SGNH/GDSL hydrolase family protein n=1 Tax=Geodermatophilus sp. CPCC 206100 TaxID=3020054 RepID=UPI003B00209D
MRRRLRVPLPAVALLAVLLAVLVACGTPGASGESEASPAGTGGSEPPAPAPPEPVGFAVVGDSITAGTTAPVEGTRADGAGSWIPAAAVPPLAFRGGWAVPGATTADMRAEVGPVDAEVLVVMGGTNDLQLGIPWEQSRADLVSAVGTAGVGAVVLSGIPPLDRAPQAALDHNGALRQLAGEQGWTFVDPWTESRTPQGTWVPGASGDGVHPTQQVADLVGGRLRAAVLDRADG